jgi:hypothetical protein
VTGPGNDERRPARGGVAVEQRSNHNDSGSDRLNLAAHAAAYARAGLPVWALHNPVDGGCSCGDRECRSVGKHPRTRNGKDDVTTDRRRIAALWTCWPDANIGLRPAEGVAVLDVDPRHRGDSTLVALLGDLGKQLPATLTANTGGGGLHIWFASPGSYRGQLCEGVDIKSSAGYVVAEPSLHASGRRYRWAKEHQIAPAPSWLPKLIRRPSLTPSYRPIAVGGSGEDGVVRTVAIAAKGDRNKALHWAARRGAETAPPLSDEVKARLRVLLRLTGREARAA